VPHGPCALCAVENRPSGHGALARWRTWRGCLRGQRATVSTLHRWPRLFRTDTVPGGRLRLRSLIITASSPVPHGPCSLRPVEDRPTSHGVHAGWRTGVNVRWRIWCGCLCGQRKSYSTPHLGHGSFSPTPSHVGGSEFATLQAQCPSPVPRGSRELRPVENRPTGHGAHARAGGLGVVVFAANAGRAPPHAVGQDYSAPTPCQADGCGFGVSCSQPRAPWRTARARFAPCRTDRPATEYTCAGGLGVVVVVANKRRVPSHVIGQGSFAPTPRQADGCDIGAS